MLRPGKSRERELERDLAQRQAAIEAKNRDLAKEVLGIDVGEGRDAS